ncbi:MAG: GpE family phage tail protein [Shewanella sp.]|jgi:hypothetical protein
MADIAIIFHWPLSEMAAMDIEELMGWHDKALDRWEKINRVKHE